MEPPEQHLRLQPGQRELTSEQAIEVDRFASERLQAQLSTDLIDETAAEALLARAYTAAGLKAPHHIHWLGGPLELVAVLLHTNESISVEDQYCDLVPHCVWDDVSLDQNEIERLERDIKASVDHVVRQLTDRAEMSVEAAFSVGSHVHVLSE